MARMRVLIADDHALVREGIRALLPLADDIEVVGEAADGAKAIAAAQKLDPDVFLMDIAMPGLGGLEATLAIRKQQPAREDPRPDPVRRSRVRRRASSRTAPRATCSRRRPAPSWPRRSARSTAAAWCSTHRSRATP